MVFRGDLYIFQRDKTSLLVFFLKAIGKTEFFGNVVNAASCPGVAPEYPPASEYHSLDGSVLPYSFNGICGTGGVISASWGQIRGNKSLVKFYGQYNDRLKKLREPVKRGHFFICLFCFAGSLIAGMTLLLKNFAI